MSDVGWLAVAYLAVAVGIGGYLLSISARRRGLKKRIEEQRARRVRGDG